MIAACKAGRAAWLVALLAACGGKDAPSSDDSEAAQDTAPQDADGDGAPAHADCDDADPLTHPGAEERCDEADQDCDGVVDEGVTRQAWTDADGDGYGDPEAPLELCSTYDGAVLNDRDCDDADPAVSPAGAEDCDFVDDDCDGVVDEGAPGATTWYLDGDGDGHGDPSSGALGCEEGPSGAVADDGDCDDSDASVYPGAEEVCEDGVVNDCAGDAASAWALCGLVGEGDLGARTATLSGPGSDRFGHGVAFAGDVNGDGYEDVIVGAEMVTHQEILDGSAYLFHGPLAGSYAPADAAAELQGEAYYAYVGLSVLGPGDLNGDGYDDLVVGSLHSRLNLSADSDLGGGLHVLFGPVSGAVPQTSADLELRVDALHNHLGSYSAAGDLDHDGHVDLVTTALLTSTEQAQSPALVAYFGPFAASSSARSPDLQLMTREEIPDLSGLGVGDLDGDGGDDLALGMLPDGGVGLYLGPLQSGSQALSAPDHHLSAASGDDAGQSVAILPDADGDGYSDLAVSVSDPSGGGVVYLLLGPVSSGALEASSSAALLGASAQDHGGHALAVADHDGDGLSDLYVQTASPDARVSAVPGDLSGSWDVEDAAIWSIVGTSAAGGVGGGLAAGQLDDDPWPELLLGSGGTDGLVSIIDGVGY